MANELKVIRSWKVELEEMSGLAVREGDAGLEILAIADNVHHLAVMPISQPDAKRLGKPYVKLGKLIGKKGASQWEAVATDDAGNVFVLEENPGGVIGFSRELDRVLGRIELDVEDMALVPGWKTDANSRGEGLLLLANGHLLLAKEKRPPMLVEVAPLGVEAQGVTGAALRPGTFTLDGDVRFAAVAVWSLANDLGDVSDIAATADGRLFAVSDQSNVLVEIALPLDPASAVAIVKTRWQLPAEIQKAEGLVMRADGAPVIGVDCKSSLHDLFLLEPIGE